MKVIIGSCEIMGNVNEVKEILTLLNEQGNDSCCDCDKCCDCEDDDAVFELAGEGEIKDFSISESLDKIFKNTLPGIVINLKKNDK